MFFNILYISSFQWIIRIIIRNHGVIPSLAIAKASLGTRDPSTKLNSIEVAKTEPSTNLITIKQLINLGHYFIRLCKYTTEQRSCYQHFFCESIRNVCLRFSLMTGNSSHKICFTNCFLSFPNTQYLHYLISSTQ